MKNPRRGKTLTTNIPIYSLSGGVGRQAPSKRLPSESQELINTMVTVERSIEKRPGTDLMGIQNFGSSLLYTGEELNLDGTGNYEFFWHSLSDSARYLFVIDRGASDAGVNEKLFYTFYFNQDEDIFEEHTQQDQSGINADVRAYITYKEGANYTPLKVVSRGQNLVFLNPDVAAGYTSTYNADDEEWYTHTLSGAQTTTVDTIGAKEEYLTATKVDPGGIAVYWDQHSNYIQGTQVIVVPGSTTILGHGGGTGHDNGIHAAENYAANGDSSVVYEGPVQYYYILQAVTSVPADAEIAEEGNWIVIATDNPDWDTAITEAFTGGSIPPPDLDTERTPKQVEVKDWQYPDSTKPQLGQALPTFTDLRLPPLDSDVLYGNNNAQDMLVALYGLQKGIDANADGIWDDLGTGINDPVYTGGVNNGLLTNSAEGKVYYVQTSYQGQAPGYYIAKSVVAPHMMKVRTPDEYSVIDDKRMPMQLEFVGGAVGSQWEWSTLEWAHRTSGDKDTNPGPTPFRDGKQSKISTMAFFRNRLWLASGDVIFSSRDSDYTDLWIEDPGVIVDTDPIDVAASTNKYTPITSMVPFKDYMFVNTAADTQYELAGSENQITPFTAELQPMTFYSTAPLVDPLTLGNNIFFYDAERLYLYLGRGGTLSTAAELSSHCPRYLPVNYGATAVAAAQDTLLAVDADAPNDVYLYTTRYRGDQVVQNAFYKYSYDSVDIKSMRAWDNYVYMVNQRDSKYFIERQLLRYDDNETPRLDRKKKLTIVLGDTLSANDQKYEPSAVNAIFDPSTITTTVRIPYVLDVDKEYVFVDTTGVVFGIDSISAQSTYSDIVVSGNLSEGDYWFGESFVMLAQLSTQFFRNQDNNPTEGILNIATMVTRHYNTGNYDIVVQRRGRPVDDILTAYDTRDTALSNFTTSFAAPRSNTYSESNLPIGNIEYQGELVSKIMGFSDKIEIFILSDYFTPINITNIQMRGKFKQTYSGVL